MAETTLVGAITLAMARAMEEDPAVLVLGEDVAANGGVFRATDGLLARFGPKRVMDTPLAEGLIGGMSVGLAAQGFKPVAEIQFMGFAYPVLDQLINHASRLRNRTRGRLSCPLVIRMPMGAGIHAPEHHSESTEALLAHIPGLRTVVLSSPARAYGLMLAAIRDPDPVVVLEPSRLYRSVKEEVVDNGESLALDRCFVVRPGRDVTLVAWGALVREALAAADTLLRSGVEAEVIDVATLAPLDMDTILESVVRTGRCVVAQEAPLTGGFGAEIAARLASEGLLGLQAPVGRVAAPDVVVPQARLETLYIQDRGRIEEAARRAVAFA